MKSVQTECFDIATVDCFIPTENKLLPNGTKRV